MDRLAGRDQQLIQIVDAAMAEAIRRGGELVQCRLGCTECCEGPFEINTLDSLRLQRGYRRLRETNPDLAAAILARAQAFSGEESELCPALDASSGACQLYEWRPMICRTFGPAVSNGPAAVAICHLNYRHTDSRELLALAVDPDPEGLESALLAELGLEAGGSELTVATAISAV